MEMQKPKAFLGKFFLKTTHCDFITPICLCLLSGISVLLIYASQFYTNGQKWKWQIAWLCLGWIVYWAASLLDYKILLKYVHWCYLGAILLLLLLWTPLGRRVYGALRWISVGGFSFQPSDFAKVGTLFYAAGLLARSETEKTKIYTRTLLVLFFVFFIPFFLIFLQPDLGSALVFPPIAFGILFISKLNYRFFIGSLVLFLLMVGVIAWDTCQYKSFLKNSLTQKEKPDVIKPQFLIPLKNYQRNRILAFIAPSAVDPAGVGISWNRKQSLIAIGSGRLIGKGFLQGSQAQLGYLPRSVASNDFIFSILGEEMGFLGSCFVLGIYTILLMNGFRMAGIACDRFGTFLAVGITLILLTHVFVNIGMTIGLMPITGIPLPFISYGGSHVVVCFLLQGILQSIYRYRHYN